MRRSFTLIRLILEYVEKNQNGPLPLPEINGYSESQIAEHVLLCCEAGFLECDTSGPLYGETTRTVANIRRMTWKGHENLDRLRQTVKP